MEPGPGTCTHPAGCDVCGNGLIEDGDGCDDGNTEDGDGCSADCTEVEEHYSCVIEGQACDRCGDGELGDGAPPARSTAPGACAERT